jgi:hypothetical protein
VLDLELLWTEIAERRMQSALVVGLVDEVRKVLHDVFELFIRHRIDLLVISPQRMVQGEC